MQWGMYLFIDFPKWITLHLIFLSPNNIRVINSQPFLLPGVWINYRKMLWFLGLILAELEFLFLCTCFYKIEMHTNKNSSKWYFVTKIVLMIEKNFWNSRPSASNLQKFWDNYRTIYSNSERSDQFLVTECFFNLFLEVSHI